MMEKTTINSLLSLSARVLISLMFIGAGYSKIGGYSATQGYMESVGVTGLLLPLVIAIELLGGVAILLGYQTRIAAFLLAGFTLLTAVIFHSDFSQQIQMILFMKNLAVSGAFLLLFVHGPGDWAINSKN